MDAKYCRECKDSIEPKREWSAGAIILLILGILTFIILIGIVLLIVAIALYYTQAGKCPSCGGKNWGVKPRK